LSTVAWNVVEAVVALAAGAIAGSVALISFGIDSSVEIISAVIVSRRLWREYRGSAGQNTDLLEMRAARITGGLLLLLAVYIVVDAGRRLIGFGEDADASLAGIALTGVSLLVMPLLGWAKLHTAHNLHSAAMRADAFETIACAWLSLTTLLGLALNAALGWSWADPLAAMLITPMIVREGIEGWQSGKRSQDFRERTTESSRR
jgi:divalent metal cation (Fe/Co/Zn/Cd) transporter